ncbi:MAG TPA: YaiO family outer membrane beta-barrel protein [Sphingomicrobium sp.]
MKHYSAIVAVILLAHAGSASAKPLDLKSIAASVDGEYLSYSGPYGKRQVVSARSQLDNGATKLSFAVSHGIRSAGEDKFHSTRLQVSVTHDWSSRFSSRTEASIASSNPVFVNRELIQDFSYKVMPRTVLTVGGRYARYSTGLDTWSWSAGAAQYFPGGYVSYRFSSFDTQHLGHSVGHIVSAKVSDPYGATQLWAGHGTSLNDADWLLEPQKGTYTSVELRRLQPIGGGVSLTIGAKRTWFEADSAKYHGTGVHVGLAFAQ